MIATSIVDEIKPMLPARLQKASVTRAGRLVLEVYAHVDGGGAKRWLDVDTGAVHVGAERPERAEEDAPPAVQGLVRKELLPGALTAIDVDALHFGRGDGKARVMVIESARAVLCAPVDEGLRILAVLGDPKTTDGRDLRRGRMYVKPPPAAAGAPGAPTTEHGAASSPRAPRAPVDPVAAALQAVRVRLRAERKRLKRLVDALGGDLVKHADPAVHEEAGELLKTVLARIARGMSAVDVVDWSGAPRTLALDPALDPKENLARFFKRAKKAREARARVMPRLDEARSALARVDAALASASLEGAEALLASPAAGGSARRRAAKAGKRQSWRSFTCSGGVVVRVGRGAKDNDALVKSARGNDLWLHARDQAGAHVVVPSTGADVEAELLLDAAHLAAHFSAARTESRVDVQHARIKNVKKPGPGAPAGLVHVSHESVLHLRVEAARVARLLAAEVPA